MSDYQDVLSFWFEQPPERWWRSDEAFDQVIRERFGALYEAVFQGGRSAWLESAQGRLAFIIVLDQFSRNMFRGTARMFAADPAALAAALEGIRRNDDRAVGFDQRLFFYMPLMHSENLEAQERCVTLWTLWRDQCTGAERESVSANLKYAERHRDVILRFGRFPHRNPLLGRTSTPEEEQFLAEGGSFF